MWELWARVCGERGSCEFLAAGAFGVNVEDGVEDGMEWYMKKTAGEGTRKVMIPFDLVEHRHGIRWMHLHRAERRSRLQRRASPVANTVYSGTSPKPIVVSRSIRARTPEFFVLRIPAL